MLSRSEGTNENVEEVAKTSGKRNNLRRELSGPSPREKELVATGDVLVGLERPQEGPGPRTEPLETL